MKLYKERELERLVRWGWWKLFGLLRSSLLKKWEMLAEIVKFKELGGVSLRR